MKKLIQSVFLLICCLLFINCSNTTPEKYFNIAVLNTNLLSGFASNGMLRQLGSPSVKLGENNETVQMKSTEIIKDKIKFIEENFGKVKDLEETEDTKEMIQASIALYEFVLPVYKKDYLHLAESLDKGESEDKINSESQTITEKYFSKYDELYKKLISIGKIYAEKNNIKVNWGEN
jgi:hypothetical protein